MGPMCSARSSEVASGLPTTRSKNDMKLLFRSARRVGQHGTKINSRMHKQVVKIYRNSRLLLRLLVGVGRLYRSVDGTLFSFLGNLSLNERTSIGTARWP